MMWLWLSFWSVYFFFCSSSGGPVDNNNSIYKTLVEDDYSLEASCHGLFPVSELAEQKPRPWKDFSVCLSPLRTQSKVISRNDPVQRICFSSLFTIYTVCNNAKKVEEEKEEVKLADIEALEAKFPDLCTDLTNLAIKDPIPCEEHGRKRNSNSSSSSMMSVEDCQRNSENMKEMAEFCSEACFPRDVDSQNVCKYLLFALKLLPKDPLPKPLVKNGSMTKVADEKKEVEKKKEQQTTSIIPMKPKPEKDNINEVMDTSTPSWINQLLNQSKNDENAAGNQDKDKNKRNEESSNPNIPGKKDGNNKDDVRENGSNQENLNKSHSGEAESNKASSTISTSTTTTTTTTTSRKVEEKTTVKTKEKAVIKGKDQNEKEDGIKEKEDNKPNNEEDENTNNGDEDFVDGSVDIRGGEEKGGGGGRLITIKTEKLNAIKEQSSAFSYFLLISISLVIIYLCFHNKQKILALILEGRRKRGGRRRGSSAQYRKLDNNLEEAPAEERSGGSLRHVIY